MFLTVHSAAGLLIAEQTNNIWLAFSLGFLSHFLLDMIPHGDNTLVKEKFKFSDNEIRLLKRLTGTDVLIMGVMLLSLYLTGHLPDIWLAAWAVAGTILPDFLQGIYVLTKTKLLEKYFSIHWNLHYALKGLTVPLKTGLIIQLIFLTTFLTLLVIN